MSSTHITDVVRYFRENINEHDNSRILKPYVQKAGWIARSISPFIDLEYTLSLDDEATENDRAIRDMVLAVHPDLFKLLEEFSNEDEESDAFSNFLGIMSKAMNAARANDTHAFKYYILSFLPSNIHTPIVATRDKHIRGWHHKWTARALCPLKFIEEFDENPIAFMKKVEMGSIKIRAKDLPSFLFPEGTEYDSENPDRDLFRSSVIIKGLRLVFTGSSSVDNGHRANTKPSQAEMHGMRAVTSRTVAYTACQVYVALSNSINWESKISYFNLEKFHDNIVGLFSDDPNDTWSIETLKYLTEAVPSLKRVTKRRRGDISDSDDDSDSGDPTGIHRARAAAREAALAQQEAEPMNQDEHEQDDTAPSGDPTPSNTQARRLAAEDREILTPPTSSPGVQPTQDPRSSPPPPRSPRAGPEVDNDNSPALRANAAATGRMVPRGHGRGRGRGRGSVKRGRGRGAAQA